ncbi:DNA alkylation repair protein [Aureibacter tunicatorum]|uniref:3-methyladenine DNA glycosylase AlkD n=1 Tax=Aureibacter tunicatorum TaxID=866807 RepID=A0AAE3XGW9_9BACT|nr:DNA alkylation repair protein [Aureibacter tunicatorum]MDR6237396.1 3-methyladenine DNA glycosylase AlkD [Aureibacter tunicatorum]BDD06386.1 hypothetical protein AUTU_38690 [Aureibacter tunicatorum]
MALSISKQNEILLNSLRLKYEAASDKKKALQKNQYFRNLFESYGISNPDRRAIDKQVQREINYKLLENDIKTIVKTAYQKKQREWQHFAMEIHFSSRKTWVENDLKTIEFMLVNKSWWDTVDYISSNSLGEFMKKRKEQQVETFKKWRTSYNIWLRRASILFQLKYKEKTDIDMLAKNIIPSLSSNEFFLQKAIGWSLRQYAKTDPNFVSNFVDEHDISGLARREALKHINKS